MINLYGNIVNPKQIVLVDTNASGYIVFLSAGVTPTSAIDKNYIEITAETVQTVDDLPYHEPSKLYMMAMINALSRRDVDDGRGEDSGEA